jgi:hypothetical protein
MLKAFLIISFSVFQPAPKFYTLSSPRHIDTRFRLVVKTPDGFSVETIRISKQKREKRRQRLVPVFKKASSSPMGFCKNLHPFG